MICIIPSNEITDKFFCLQLCFPVSYFRDVIIPRTNANLQSTKNQQLTMSEFFTFLGCIFYTACFEGISDRRDWWSSSPVERFRGAPDRLHDYMSGRRFEDIMQALRFTNTPQPQYNDRFHDVRQMIEAFNNHYMENYTPGWISCIDKSMIDWLNKYCPGWMCVPRKPHPFGNEYHTICDSDLTKG